MTYEYLCTPCNHSFDIIKRASEMTNPEHCPKCNQEAVRQFVPRRVFFSGTSVQNPEYNPGLGCVVNNKAHREEIAKQRGLVEVGNDYGSGETMQTKFDTERTEKREKAWESL